ncbi:VOC family protein [Glycomyces salinus]|uniref:VOC family protein n=1 Tax=Glycomyces salinus TaxID=980294 RepID=UPI0018EE2F1C|nr:VOC family protein [Glycomyces salinus]
MTEYHSPVPLPDLHAEAPEIYWGFYGMPMFTLSPTADLEASRDFWIEGLGFVDLFTIPGQVTHLRRWAFQDVLLVPGEQPEEASAVSVNFACVPDQIEQIRQRCEELVPGCTQGPREMPWNSVELTVVTPERTKVVMTAARPIDPESELADELREAGFQIPKP